MVKGHEPRVWCQVVKQPGMLLRTTANGVQKVRGHEPLFPTTQTGHLHSESSASDFMVSVPTTSLPTAVRRCVRREPNLRSTQNAIEGHSSGVDCALPWTLESIGFVDVCFSTRFIFPDTSLKDPATSMSEGVTSGWVHGRDVVKKAGLLAFQPAPTSGSHPCCTAVSSPAIASLAKVTSNSTEG
eukprot:5350727-Amphidinium_carterae.2